MKTNNNSIFENLKYDLPASVVVFLVAVPLCLGIALASGAPLFSGIIAGMIGGIVVGALSGSQNGVSGPAAGLAAIVVMALSDLGAFETFLLAVVIAGILQIIMGFLRLGIVGYYFPTSVIKGMLSGIGIIIIIKMIPHALGNDDDPVGELSFNQPDGQTTFSELFNMLDFISPSAIIITVISLAILILWEQGFMKRQKIFQLIQGPLVVVVGGIILTLIFQSIPEFALTSEHLVSIPITNDLEGFRKLFVTPDFSQWSNPSIYYYAGIIALVASIETLLCVEASDKLDPYKRVTPTNRELKAQGVGNLISGLIGGLPITQVIVRSSANIQSGGRSKVSTIVHGFLILICVVSIPAILNLIPMASLAAILFVVGYKLAKPTLFKQMYGIGWNQFIPFITTIVAIVFTDLLMGITIGLVVAILFVLYDNFKKPYFFNPEEHLGEDEVIIELSQHVTFLHRASILQTLNHIPKNSKVLIDGRKSKTIDHDVIEIIEDFKENAKYKNIELVIKGLENEEVELPVDKFSKAVNGNNGTAVKKSKAKAPLPK